MPSQFRSFIALPTAGVLAAMPGLARADVTPADVWANMQAAISATGASVRADTSDTGNTLTVSDITLVYTLPMAAGSITIGAGSLLLTDNGDGTVDLGGTATQEVSFAFDMPDVGGGVLTMTYSVSNYSNTASGTPGDITYDYDIAGYDVSYGDISVTGDLAEEVGSVDITGTLRMSGLSGTYRFTEGALVTIATDGTIDRGRLNFAYEVTSDGDVIRSTSDATLGRMGGKTSFALPAGGASLLALAGALRDGMSLEYSFSGESQDSRQETTMNAELVMAQFTDVGAIEGSLTFDKDGLRVAGTAQDYDIEVNQPLLLPVPIKVTLAGAAFDMAFPVLQSQALQDTLLKFALDGVSLDPQLWAMFDPGAVLSRDPISLEMDVSAKLRLLYDVLDFAALMELGETGAAPAEVHAVDVASINVKAVGAEADVTGAFTFDNDNLSSFDGLPAPDGAATITLTGIDALLERLQSMGLMSDGDMSGARMFLGGFTREGTSAGQRVTEIEIDGAAGTIAANGMRIK